MTWRRSTIETRLTSSLDVVTENNGLKETGSLLFSWFLTVDVRDESSVFLSICKLEREREREELAVFARNENCW